LRHEPWKTTASISKTASEFARTPTKTAAVDAAAASTRKGLEDGTLPPFIGIRVKSFSGESKRIERLRTLTVFQGCRQLPEEFVATCRRFRRPSRSRSFREMLAPYPDVGVELMVETSFSVTNLAELVDLAEGRCVGRTSALTIHIFAGDHVAQSTPPTSGLQVRTLRSC